MVISLHILLYWPYKTFLNKLIENPNLIVNKSIKVTFNQPIKWILLGVHLKLDYIKVIRITFDQSKHVLFKISY